MTQDNQCPFISRITLTSEDVITQFPSICSLKEMISKKDSCNSDVASRFDTVWLLIGWQYTEQIALLTRLEGSSSISFPSLTAYDGFMSTLSKFEEWLKTPFPTTGG